MPRPIQPATNINFDRKVIDEFSAGIVERITGQLIEQNTPHFFPFIGYLCTIPRENHTIHMHFASQPITASNLVTQLNAAAIINGGFWDKQKRPLDWCVWEGNTITSLHNNKRPCIYWSNARQPIISIGMPDINYPHTAVLQAGPLLLKDGQIQTDYSDFQINAAEFDSDITADRHPRTIFGYNQNSYFFLVIDGRSLKTAGLYLEECAKLTQQLGFIDAINLDGGASSTLVVSGKRINEPRFSIIRGSRWLSARLPGKERPVPTFLYVI
jgi:hypothetical protein